jgi:Undecaprenyl-phosphate galactose phosphotransferase WbaP
LTSPALVLSDVIVALCIWVAAFGIQSLLGNAPASPETVATVGKSIAAWVGLRALLGLYPGYGLGQVEELRRQTYAVLAAAAMTAIFALAVQVGYLLSRMVLALGFLGLLLLAPLARHLVKRCLRRIELWGKPVVILGSDTHGERVATLLDREWTLGYKPIVVFGARAKGSTRRRAFEAVPDEASLSDALSLSRRCGVDDVIIAMPQTRRQYVAKLVDWAGRSFQHVTVIPNLDGVTNSSVVARDFAGVFGVEIRHNLLVPSVRRAKRIVDIFAVLTGGALILPLILAISLLVWLEAGGPVFYKAERLGRDGKKFSCVKFRTMVNGAEERLRRVLEEDPIAREEYAKYHKLRDDPRVTRVGRILRKTSLDELPQLWNVLKGEMSLVGPRPYLPRESVEIGETQTEILRVYPGITGPWQVGGRNKTSFDERVEIDARYVRNWSIWLDILILALTVRALLLNRGAY